MYKLTLKDKDGVAILEYGSYDEAIKGKKSFENCGMYYYIEIE